MVGPDRHVRWHIFLYLSLSSTVFFSRFGCNGFKVGWCAFRCQLADVTNETKPHTCDAYCCVVEFQFLRVFHVHCAGRLFESHIPLTFPCTMHCSRSDLSINSNAIVTQLICSMGPGMPSIAKYAVVRREFWSFSMKNKCPAACKLNPIKESQILTQRCESTR